MTVTASGTALLRSLLGAKPAPVNFPWQISASVLDVETMLELLDERLHALTQHAPDLQRTRDLIAAWLADPYVFDFRIRNVESALLLVVAYGNNIARIGALANAPSWPAGLDAILGAKARDIRTRYCDAVHAEIRSAGSGLRLLEDADKELLTLPALISRTMVVSHLGTEAMIDHAAKLWTALRTRRTLNNAPLVVTRPADSYVALTVATPSGEWQADADLRNRLHNVRIAIADADRPTAALVALNQRLDAFTVTLTALLAKDELEQMIDKVTIGGIIIPTVIGVDFTQDHLTRLTGYVTALEDVIQTMESSYSLRATADAATPAGQRQLADAGQKQVSAGSQLRALMSGALYSSDVSTLVERAQDVETVKTALKAAAVMAAAGLGAAAGAALAEGLILTPTLAKVGEFAAEVVLFTMASRLGNELAFGPAAVDRPFLEELAVNAVMMGLIKLAMLRFEKMYPNLTPWKKFLGGFVITNVILYDFTQVQTMLATGEILSGDEHAKAVFQQLLGFVAITLGTKLAGSLQDRLGHPPQVDPVKLQALEALRDQVRPDIERARNGQLPVADGAELFSKLEQLANEELALLRERLAPDHPDIAKLQAEYQRLEAEITLGFAARGLESPSISGRKPPFEPVAPGVVGHQAGAEAALDAYYQEHNGTLEPSDVAGFEKGTLPGSASPIHHVPAPDVGTPLSAPARRAAARQAALAVAEVDDVARLGLQRLDATFPGKAGTADKILAQAMPRRAEDAGRLTNLLRLLAHPDLVWPDGRLKLLNGWPERLKSLARSPDAIELARRHGHQLLTHLVDHFDGLTIGERSFEVGANRALSKLEDAGAQRQQVLDAMLAADGSALDALLGTEKAKIIRPRAYLNVGDMGVTEGSVEWHTFRDEEIRTHPGESPKAANLRANIAQIKDNAQRGKYSKWSFARRYAAGQEFRKVCVDLETEIGRTATGPTNTKVGNFIEDLLRPELGKKMMFFNEKAFEGTGLEPEATITDGSRLRADGVFEGIELKTHQLFEESHVDRLVRDELVDQLAKARRNQPAGSEIALWIYETLPPDLQTHMMRQLKARGVQVDRILFGDPTAPGNGWILRANFP